MTKQGRNGGHAIERALMLGGIAMAFFAGLATATHLAQAAQADLDQHRVYELDVYHVVPGKTGKLTARFHDAIPLFEKHHLKALGYWVPDDSPHWANTFVYLLAHRSLEDAKRNWAAFHADPDFQKDLKSEQEEQLIEKVDETYMRATDFSPAQ